MSTFAELATEYYTLCKSGGAAVPDDLGPLGTQVALAPVETEPDAIAALILITNQVSNFDPTVVGAVLASLREYVEARIYHVA
jgi:hypothetical protein